MGIQDNIFDVEAALEGTPELQLFEEIMERFYENERELEALRNLYFCLSDLRHAVGEAEKQLKGTRK